LLPTAARLAQADRRANAHSNHPNRGKDEGQRHAEVGKSEPKE
jgi:hypothetical protein